MLRWMMLWVIAVVSTDSPRESWSMVSGGTVRRTGGEEVQTEDVGEGWMGLSDVLDESLSDTIERAANI